MQKSLLAILFLLITASLNAQTDAGFSTGINSSKWFFNRTLPESGMSSITGWQLSGFIEQHVGKVFSLKADIYYHHTGSGYYVKSFPGNFEYRLDYVGGSLGLPLGFENQKWALKCVLGGYATYCFNGTFITNNTEDKTKTLEELDFEYNKFRNYDLGAYVGLLAKYKIGTGKIVLDCRWNAGIHSISDERAIWMCNRSWMFSLGYVWQICEGRKKEANTKTASLSELLMQATIGR